MTIHAFLLLPVTFVYIPMFTFRLSTLNTSTKAEHTLTYESIDFGIFFKYIQIRTSFLLTPITTLNMFIL